MKRAGQFQANKGHIYDMAVDKMGEKIVTIGRDGVLKLTHMQKIKKGVKPEFLFKEISNSNNNWARQVEFIADSRFVLAGQKGKTESINVSFENLDNE